MIFIKHYIVSVLELFLFVAIVQCSQGTVSVSVESTKNVSSTTGIPVERKPDVTGSLVNKLNVTKSTLVSQNTSTSTSTPLQKTVSSTVTPSVKLQDITNKTIALNNVTISSTTHVPSSSTKPISTSTVLPLPPSRQIFAEGQHPSGPVQKKVFPPSLLDENMKSGHEEKRISARKGVNFDDFKTTSNYTTKLRSKPLFTMVSGDSLSKERSSFIESPTTGGDYVLPLVLIILAVPVMVFIAKTIYRRGSEYTERRHYDRMYLIDGMYNTR